ncbi:hypothetical protein LTR47_000628 [Exophiala xenobiotica]|nr:hypothetical protein LTR47_000628 [Exophiala xenobiotica]KAK5255807.1 hypothetical protein LTS06_000263 [Exophiala xenobiotica]KAK5350316.1 hypothetical protein LTR61_006291 [Exophiala xenobiotica]KAK5387692.1 hypothetical protein LTR11_001357 [Exophiala xenobiotica]KAK5389052.1 hypothetical protein LTS03_001473 [Exophiala xenobiotica]
MTTMEAASAQEDASALSDQDLPDAEDSDLTEYFRPDEEYTSDRPSTPPNFVQYCHHCYQSLLHMSAQGKSKHRKRCEKSFEGGKRRPGAEKAKKTGICPHCNTDISALAEPAGHRFRCKKRNEAKTQKDQGETVICTYCSKDITELNNPDAHRSRCRDQRATQALGTPKHRLVQPDDIEAAAEFSTVNRFQDDSSSSNELGTSRDNESGEADNSGGESAGAKEIRHGKRIGFDTLTHRQKGHEKQIGASDTWKATQKAELERERANNRFVASTFTKNKEALRLREEELYRQKAEFAEAMYKQEAEFAEAMYQQKAEFAADMWQQEADFVAAMFKQDAEFVAAMYQKRLSLLRLRRCLSDNSRIWHAFGDHPTSPLKPGVKREAQSPLRPGPPSRRIPALHGYSNIINIGGRRQGTLEMEYFTRRRGVLPRWEPVSRVKKEGPELVSDYDDKHPEA